AVEVPRHPPGCSGGEGTRRVEKTRGEGDPHALVLKDVIKVVRRAPDRTGPNIDLVREDIRSRDLEDLPQIIGRSTRAINHRLDVGIVGVSQNASVRKTNDEFRFGPEGRPTAAVVKESV